MDRETTEKQAFALYAHLRDRRVHEARPCEGSPNHELVDALLEAVELGHFSLTACLRQPEPLLTAIKEWLHEEPAQGYNAYQVAPRAMVTIRNIGSEPLEVVTSTKTTRIPKRPDRWRTPPKEHRQHLKQTVQPNETITLPVALASSLMRRWSDRPYGVVFLETHSYHPQKRVLEEVRGWLTRYLDDGTNEVVAWGDPEEKPGRKRSKATAEESTA